MGKVQRWNGDRVVNTIIGVISLTERKFGESLDWNAYLNKTLGRALDPSANGTWLSKPTQSN